MDKITCPFPNLNSATCYVGNLLCGPYWGCATCKDPILNPIFLSQGSIFGQISLAKP